MSVVVCFKYKIVFEDKESLKEALSFFNNLDVDKSFPGELGRNKMSSVVDSLLPSDECVNEDLFTIEYEEIEDAHPESDMAFDDLLELLVKEKRNLSFEARTQTTFPEYAEWSEEYYKYKNGELQPDMKLSKIPDDDSFFLLYDEDDYDEDEEDEED